MLFRRTAILLALLSPVFVSCSSLPHQAYRAGQSCIDRSNPDYSLAYIELDDQGEYWDDAQLDHALDLIDEKNREISKLAGENSGGLFITFIHGWRNDASPQNEKDGKLNDFKEVLRTVSAAEAERARASNRPARPVVGIYIAWRGDSLETIHALRGLDFLTFWGRNATANRIASRIPSTQVLLLLFKTIQGSKNARSIVVGHSMGALILEQAISQALTSSIIEAAYKPRQDQESCPTEAITPPADLVVLVNPAAPALQTKSLIQTFEIADREDCEVAFSSRSVEKPLLLSITALNDKATKVAFPIAMTLETRRQLFQSGGNPSERHLATRTAGHSTYVHSHQPLQLDRNATPCEGELPSSQVRLCAFLPGTLAFTVGTDKYTLTRRTEEGILNAKSPYWILNAHDDVIDGHSGIFKPEFVNFLSGLITVTRAAAPGAPDKLYFTPAAEEKAAALTKPEEE